MTPDSSPSSVDDPLFESGHRIFANKDLLKIGHVPEADRIVGRDEEISKLAKRLNGAVHGYSPENVMIYGKTGTGKSLVSKHVCQRAQNAAQDGVEIGTAYIDCAEDNTETQAISSLAAKLNDESSTGISVPHTGLSTSKYYKLLWKTLDAQFDSVIIILDEIDLMNDDSVLMKLSRAEEAGKIDCSVGVIAISNKIQYVDNVNERVKSSFQHKELFFKPYDANQLREIMFNREDAFQDGVLSEDVIPLSAAFAAQEHGDARKAIDILRHAGEVAYEAGAELVTEEHVRQAQQHAEKDRFRELVNGAPTQAKAALLALTELSVNSNDDAFLTSRVYDQYEHICNHLDMDILSVRRFRDILKEQAFLGVVEIEKINKGSAGGIHLQNRLIEDSQVVRETILEDSRMQDWTRE
ncbi:orc / cell division control protein 6 (plasmid) [Halobacterium salinarum NRC-1]|uniref:ORC1-type DNA replication protein 4 n=2 Tax=Halobacterium salinarum (strain ATCC 700922 / JCM 11081 / NRC-1) TaxID=64091 RepID=CDC64_HALSA|nr:DNA replication protein Orc4 [Halobacterium salinarum]Q9HHJ7.1 RecName: Full=ORC1-type DNA replication protein 4 [Halobacterium salinarum NRC-1]AAG20983.1 orc / cell division control protein 6 [Halobacterium salinarum NRC-1]DAC79950.1 TPA_inf: orc / cell division control protein 6 [Halobacterium salinarum NRC-1]